MSSGNRTLLRRFFSEVSLGTGAVWLQGDEAQHLLKILRAQVDDEVLLFDGGGAEYLARIVTCERNRAELELLERREVDRELSFSLHLGVALPKGDRQKWLVEKCVELGVTSITPLVTQRGVAAPSTGAIDRLRRTVVESSKQCGRNRLLEIRSAQDWPAFCHDSPAGHLRLIAHPAQLGLPSLEPGEVAARPATGTLAAVGPEGGFTDEELSVARSSNWEFLTLGPRILRVETACLALAALFSMKTVEHRK